MSESSLLSVLHISDFHYSKRKWREQEIVIEALTKDLETLCIGHRRPDVIVFTGDLVQAGGVDSHADAYDKLIAKVSAATGCSDERIFVVPGNHDASQSVVRREQEIHEAWREKSDDLSYMNHMYEGGSFKDLFAEKFKDYRDLETYLSQDTLCHSNDFVSVYRIDTLNIDVVVINTAALSLAGWKEKGRDEGFLATPEYAIRDGLKALTPGSFRIFATHHPLATMSESSSRYLRGVFQQEADIHLFGHMHDPVSASVTGFEGELYTDQAGAIFTARRNSYIGYSLISVDRATSLYETHLRTFFSDRSAFDEARDIVDQGKFYSSQKAREFWRSIAKPVDDERFRSYLADQCSIALKAELEPAGPSERSGHDMFVPPPMTRNLIVSNGEDDESGMTVEVPLTFEEIVAGDDNLIIHASPQYGRTTVLIELALRLLGDAKSVRFPRIPIIVDFEDIRQNVKSFTRFVRSRAIMPGNEFDPDSLLKLGHACVMVDDIVFSDQKRMQILREFVSRYPKARYVFTSLKSSTIPFGTHVVPEMPLHFEFVELCVLRRQDMRQLISKFSGCGNIDDILDRLQVEIGEINLPFTAANGSILMVIYEEQSGFRPINRSVLVEQFVDITLRKGSVEQSQRETFDYRNKTSLLAHVAAWMARSNQYVPGAEALRDVMKTYIDRLGLNADLNALMSEFLATRLFIPKSEDRVCFRYRAVLEYFIALQMFNDSTFKAWVMEEERYLQFSNEIQYYAGKLRNDPDLIEEIGSRFDRIMDSVEAEIGKIDLDRIANLQLPRGVGDTTLQRLSDQLNEKPLESEEKDAELEGEFPRDVEERQEVFRPKVEDPGQQMLHSLFLYSGVLKNMELIEDTEKRRHLGKVWRGWGTFLHLGLNMVEDLAHHRRVRINGVLCEVYAPKDMADKELARIIALNMPTGVARLIFASLGTEKLERQLTEPDLESTEQPLVYEFFRTALIADLQLSAAGRALAIALERLVSSPYLSEALVWKISYLRRYNRLPQELFDGLASPVANTLANLQGGTRKTRLDEKRRQIERYKKQNLLIRMRRIIGGDEKIPEPEEVEPE